MRIIEIAKEKPLNMNGKQFVYVEFFNEENGIIHLEKFKTPIVEWEELKSKYLVEPNDNDRLELCEYKEKMLLDQQKIEKDVLKDIRKQIATLTKEKDALIKKLKGI